jgi:hypothetical protein
VTTNAELTGDDNPIHIDPAANPARGRNRRRAPTGRPAGARGCYAFGRNQDARAGSRRIAPNMLTRNMKVSSSPISDWNFKGEKIQVATPTASVIPVNRTPLPVTVRVFLYASWIDCPDARKLRNRL